MPISLFVCWFLVVLGVVEGSPGGSKHVDYGKQPPTPVLPTLPPLVEKSLVEIVPPQLLCPKGYEIFKNKCVRLERAPADFRCTKGFEKKDTEEGVKCVKSTLDEPVLTCLAEYNKEGNVCTRFQDVLPEFDCPSPYHLVNRKCVLKNVVAPQVFCPDGYKLENEECTRILSVAPTYYCDRDGFKLDDEILRCVGVKWEPLEFTCPSGTVPTREGRCRARKTSLPNAACPPEAVQEGNSCVTRDVIELTTVCDGSRPSDLDDNCIIERILPAQQRCPKDYTLNPQSGQCERVLTAPLQPVCLEGVLDTSTSPPQCKFQESTLPALLCPEGYEKDEDFCVKEEIEPATAACDVGSVLEAGECVREVVVDVEPSCKNGYRPAGESCVKTAFDDAKRKCAPGFDYKFGECVAEDTRPPQFSCEHGYSLHSKECISVEHVDPRPVCTCPDCQFVAGKCIFKETTSPEVSCKPSYTWNPSSRKCENVLSKQPDVYCPKGYTFSGTSKSFKHGAACIMTRTADPKASCDKGFQYDPSEKVCRSSPQVKKITQEEADGKKQSNGRSHHKSSQQNSFLHW